jgi:hypothetical protein
MGQALLWLVGAVGRVRPGHPVCGGEAEQQSEEEVEMAPVVSICRPWTIWTTRHDQTGITSVW